MRQILVTLTDERYATLGELHKAVSEDLSLEPSELFGYLIEWADQRRKEGVLWLPPKPRSKWKDWEIAALGTQPDKLLAARTGRSEWLIQQKRLDLRIPAYEE